MTRTTASGRVRGLIGLTLVLFWVARTALAEAFRWTDEQGRVHYSDQVPPEDAKHERARLNEQGRRVERIEGAKTPEQLARERQRQYLRAEQQRLLVEQHDRDLALLRSYRNEDELLQGRQNKLTTLDAIIKVTLSNRQRQADFLQSQQKKAADLELQGQPVPKSLRDNIDAVRRQIASHQEKLDGLEREKRTINESYQRDLERFRLLQANRGELERFLVWREPARLDGGNVIIGAVNCRPGSDCDRVWDATRRYIQSRTALPLFTDTPRLLQTMGPQSDGDIALIAVRIEGRSDNAVFLDLRCRPSSLGEELCAGPKGREILSGFTSAVTSASAP
jgi:hypothetical protein